MLPVFNGLGSDQSGSFESKFTFGQIDWQRIQEAEGDETVLTDLRSASDLTEIG